MTTFLLVLVVWCALGLIGLLIASARCGIYFSELFDPDIMTLDCFTICCLGGPITLICVSLPSFPKEVEKKMNKK